MLKRIDEAVAYIRSRTSVQPRLGVILGSGLGNVADEIQADVTIPYAEIPHSAASTVAGHSGRLVIGHVDGVGVALLQGRVHLYEGWEMEQVVFLARVLGRLGVEAVIVTNAAGGVNTAFSAGDLMLISDHINFMGANPLTGRNVEELGARFPDMSEAYPASLRDVARSVAASHGLELREGVYMALCGPSYETPAEIRAYRTLGADAVGMSTVPEVIALSHMGIPVLGVSCITNMASGILPQKLNHEEVIETTVRVQRSFTELLIGCLNTLGKSVPH